MLPEYQLKIADFAIGNIAIGIAIAINISIGNIKNQCLTFFNKEKYVIHYENSKLYLTLALKLKKKNCVLELNQSQWLKPYIEFNSQK